MATRVLSLLLLPALLSGCDKPPTQPSSNVASSTGATVPPPPPGAASSPAAVPGSPDGTSSMVSNDAEARFLGAYRDAHARHDADALAQLYCWDGVSAEWREVVMENIRDQAQYSISDLRLVPAQPGEHEVSDGDNYADNLTPTHTLRAKYAPASGAPGQLMLTEATFAIGMKNGRYMAVVTHPK